jgi:hypothetical protein
VVDEISDEESLASGDFRAASFWALDESLKQYFYAFNY